MFFTVKSGGVLSPAVGSVLRSCLLLQSSREEDVSIGPAEIHEPPSSARARRLRRYDADDLDLFSHSLSIKLEYYRCIEYNLKWNRHMSPRCSSRLLKASKTRVRKHPAPSQDVAPHRTRRQTRRTRLNTADGCKPDEYDEKDLLDLIDSSREDAVEIVDTVLDESDCCSIASGPSRVRHTTSKRPKSSRGPCSACRELYQKAKRTKAPIKNKLLDHDPKSLTCDQWVLIKTFRSRRLPEARQKHLSDARLNKIATSRPGESSLCSRLHIFLQRNLRRVKTAARKETKKSRMKRRRRDSSQGCRVAKQQRLQSDKGQKQNVSQRTHDDSDSGSRRRSGPKTDSRVGPEPSVEHAPSSAVPKTTTEVGSKQKAEEKCGFKQLLAQLRGNSSVIVKEKR